MAEVTQTTTEPSQLKQYLLDGGVEYLWVKSGTGGKHERKNIEECEFLDKHCGMYFSAHWCPPCRGYTPQLAKKYKEGNTQITIIFNSWDRTQDAFNSYFETMPWAAIPFEYKDSLRGSKALKSPNGIPSLYLFDDKGSLYQTKGRSSIMDRPFPYADPSMDEILDVVKGHKASDFAEKEFFGFYFSAHWCPPCRGFTPTLTKFYTDFTEKNSKFELVFVSSDRDKSSFESYHNSMSFKALDMFSDDPERKKKAGKMKSFLESIAEVQGIPHLVIMDRDCNIICKNARSEVTADPEGKNFPWKLEPVQNMERSIEGINETPSLLMLCEDEDAAKQAELLSFMQPHAEQQDAMGEKRQIMHFILTEKSDLGGRVRGFVGGVEGTACIILDVSGRKYFPAAEVPTSEEKLVQFCNEFLQGILEGQDLKLG